MARPSKLNETFLEKAEKVLWNENLVLFTDEELVEEINDQLEPNQQISTRTFIRWKQADFEEKGEIGIKFCHLMKKALRDKRQICTKNIKPKKALGKNGLGLLNVNSANGT